MCGDLIETGEILVHINELDLPVFFPSSFQIVLESSFFISGKSCRKIGQAMFPPLSIVQLFEGILSHFPYLGLFFQAVKDSRGI